MMIGRWSEKGSRRRGDEILFSLKRSERRWSILESARGGGGGGARARRSAERSRRTRGDDGVTYRFELDGHVLAFDRHHRGGAPVPASPDLGVVRAFAQHLHGGAGTVKKTRRAAPGHLRVGRVLALAGGALREQRREGWDAVGEVTLGGIRASERARARPRRRVPGHAHHGKRRDATRPHRRGWLIFGEAGRDSRTGVGGEEARTWKPVRSETKLSGAAASARRSRGWEGDVSTARERARARGDEGGRTRWSNRRGGARFLN